jgi:hypothetical protein
MGFNPKGKRRDIITAPELAVSGGKPCIVLTQGQMRMDSAKADVDFRAGELTSAPPTHNDTVRRQRTGAMEVYIEWWKLGTDAGDINSGTFSTISIKHFCKTFGKHKHLSMVFLRRECDQKVLYDRRTN